MNNTWVMKELTQIFPEKKISSIKSAVYQALDGSDLKQKIIPGQRVAITAGSRGISNISLILKTLVEYISSLGCLPSIISAMGSHGGNTIAGQLSILNKLGITMETMGAPVVASDQSILFCSDGDRKCYVNILVKNYDHIIVVNRIKPHTTFSGIAESGLQKMMAVGLGGNKSALTIHQEAPDFISSAIIETSDLMINNLPIALGLAIIEDAKKNTMLIEAILPKNIKEKEERLLEIARLNMPRLPFDKLDLLIVDEIGKNISGTGMDSNIIGRRNYKPGSAVSGPAIEKIVVLNLTEETNGNGYGIGLADFTTRRLVEAIDYKAMYTNALTSTYLNKAMVPPVLSDDLSAIREAIKTFPKKNKQLRIARIKNTLEIERILVSPEAAESISSNNSNIIFSDQATSFKFDKNNNLLPF
ncbi:MAG: DUF2088 domain-containing protein [Peptococcaceae bacterium]|nr:DUF2088 domain-containing protein [Peptococcaceae bacterium]